MPPAEFALREGHGAQFYADEDVLLADLNRLVGSALGAGDAAIVLATPSHRKGLHRRLKASGFDVGQAEEQGRYCARDAAETLAVLMPDGLADQARFENVVGGLVAQVRASIAPGKRLVIFGEMVSLLCAQGNSAAALRLEQLWNDLARTQSFYLHCAYPMSVFDRPEDGRLLEDVCGQHLSVIPMETYVNLAADGEKLREITRLQQKALALEAEIALRERAEAELQLKHRELADFLENSAVGIHRVAADGTIQWANLAELQMLGYQAEEYVGHNIAEFHVHAAVIDDILARLSRHETLDKYQSSLRCKDGSIKDVLISSNVLWDGDRFVHTRCFTIDVTDRKRAEDALRASEARLRVSEERLKMAQKIAGVGTWELNLDSEEYVWSDEVYEMFGQPASFRPTYEQLLSSMYFSSDREHAEKALRVTLTRRKDYETQFRIRRPDGQVRMLSARGKVIYNQGYSILVGVFIDVTRISRANPRERLAS